MATGWWATREGGIEVTVRVVPGARRSELVDVSAAALRIRVGAPARDGKANLAVVRLIADLFGVRPSAVAIVRGETLRDKVVAIHGITEPPPALRDQA
jgi:uncharacterized protein (TIGR00251 family)